MLVIIIVRRARMRGVEAAYSRFSLSYAAVSHVYLSDIDI
jgi:hypothetical protein